VVGFSVLPFVSHKNVVVRRTTDDRLSIMALFPSLPPPAALIRPPSPTETVPLAYPVPSSELFSKLEQAGDAMKLAVQARLGIVLQQTQEEQAAASESKSTETAVMAGVKNKKVEIKEADQKLEQAVAEVKQAVEQVEERVSVAADTVSSKSSNDAKDDHVINRAIAELETAVQDLEQAVVQDEAGEPLAAEKLLTAAESELETAIEDVENAVSSLLDEEETSTTGGTNSREEATASSPLPTKSEESLEASTFTATRDEIADDSFAAEQCTTTPTTDDTITDNGESAGRLDVTAGSREDDEIVEPPAIDNNEPSLEVVGIPNS